MRVFVAGATGAIGRQLVPRLVAAGHAIRAVDTRHMERDFAQTNGLRTEGTDHLLSAGQAVGVRRFVAQGNIALYARTGGLLRVHQALDGDEQIASTRAFVATVTTRLAITELRSSRALCRRVAARADHHRRSR